VPLHTAAAPRFDPNEKSQRLTLQHGA
jgi:hypothetical protein